MRFPHHSPFGTDRFGVLAERFARFFGTPAYLMAQTLVVILWLVINGLVVVLRWDPYPFILLNLLFSTQAAYAAPLILLAETRQADRDMAQAELDAADRLADRKWQREMIERIEALAELIHEHQLRQER